MISGPSCCSWSVVSDFTDASVPTGMNTGVWMVPCRVTISPRRAAPSVARIRKESLLIAFVILSRRAASAKREAAERGEGSQDAQTPAETSGIQRNLGSLRSFAVLRDFAFGYVASAAQDDS